MYPHPEQSFDSEYHAPVMVREVVEHLRMCSTVLDCTLGGGGHSEALLDAGVSSVTGIDRDPEAIAVASVRLTEYGPRFRAVPGDFTRIDELAVLQGSTFSGILADLGVSSHQLNDDPRGFSFRPGVPLDMRMEGAGESAAEWLNYTSEQEIADALHEYGDEPKARRLATEIVRRRGNRPFVVSDDLVGAIRGVLGARSGPSDFARLFQAVRIAVNNELNGLDRVLPLLRDRLEPNGVLAIIAYHSGEDRRVKQAFREWSVTCTCPPKQPICTCGGRALGTLVTRKALVAPAEEAEHNSRARSARLRVWRKNA